MPVGKENGLPHKGARLTGVRRQIDIEDSAHSQLAIDGNGAAVVLDHAMDYRQPEAGSFTRSLGRKEWLKDAFLRGAVYAAPGVAHRQTDMWSFLEIRVSSSEMRVDLELRQADLQNAPAPLHRVPGIHTQIHYHLLYQCRIAQHPGSRGIDVSTDFNRRGQRSPQQLQSLADYRLQFEHLALTIFLAAARKDL